MRELISIVAIQDPWGEGISGSKLYPRATPTQIRQFRTKFGEYWDSIDAHLANYHVDKVFHDGMCLGGRKGYDLISAEKGTHRSLKAACDLVDRGADFMKTDSLALLVACTTLSARNCEKWYQRTFAGLLNISASKRVVRGLGTGETGALFLCVDRIRSVHLLINYFAPDIRIQDANLPGNAAAAQLLDLLPRSPYARRLGKPYQ